MQNTLAKRVTFNGIGLHTGKPVSMVINPAAADTGIVFRRGSVLIPAIYSSVLTSPLCTFLGDGSGFGVSTVEHLMAALWALSIDNAIIDVSSDELPIMDGSALPFMSGVGAVGTVQQLGARRAYKVVKAVEYREGNSVSRLVPAANFSAEITIDFDHPSIGRQSARYDGSLPMFLTEFSMTRTFCMERDVEAMKASGKALGGSLDNAVVFNDRGIANPMGLRVEDEPVRHKMLDAIGDLALLGGRLNGKFEASRPGHKMTNLLLRKAVAEGALCDARTGRTLVSSDQRDLVAA